MINYNNITYKCENCDKYFRTTRKPIERKNNSKCLCKDCSFSNKIFKIKHILNKNNEKITYQSSPELELINFCNDNDILIKNGPHIKYFFDGKIRQYHIDFIIEENGLLIEIKDNHIWHKNQVKSGKWKLKETAAKKYAKKNNLKYKLIFTQYLKDFLNTF